MKQYKLYFRWIHRKWGLTQEYGSQTASSLPLALKRGTAKYLKELSASDRRDANKFFTVQATFVKAEKPVHMEEA